ncbi:hypothetical protein ES703_09298 [subsurface metagenome]
MGVSYQEESNADLYWNATSRLEVLSGRLKAMKQHSLAHLVDEAIGRLHTVGKEMEKK